MLNDFEANGYGVTALEPEHVVVLNDVPPTPQVHTLPPDAPTVALIAHAEPPLGALLLLLLC